MRKRLRNLHARCPRRQDPRRTRKEPTDIGKPEIRNPKPEITGFCTPGASFDSNFKLSLLLHMLRAPVALPRVAGPSGLGFRPSAFFRVSAFGFRTSCMTAPSRLFSAINKHTAFQHNIDTYSLMQCVCQ